MCFFICRLAFYLLLVLNYVAAKSHVEFIFSVMPLGHSGFLISWEPNIPIKSEETSEYRFKFHAFVAEEKHKNENTSVHNSTGFIWSSDGQYMIHSLTGNTPYEIIINQFNSYADIVKTYSIKNRTNVKSNRTPAKPYFEYLHIPYKVSWFNVLIKWFPCGREKSCHDQESGTHFGVKIKELYSTTRSSEVKREERFKYQMSVHFLVGKLYEVIVYSVNGDYQTDSDSQEIYLKPMYPPVRHVNVISLPDSSILISWKRPKESQNDKYLIFRVVHFNFSIDNILFEEDYEANTASVSSLGDDGETQRRLFDLIPEVIYTIFINPYSFVGEGFEYRMEYIHRSYNYDLQIAKPDFDYELLAVEDIRCEFYFYWLPCGKSFDCKNNKPGSNYTFQFEPKSVKTINIKNHALCLGHFESDVEYYVTVKSSFGNQSSESDTKIFKNCQEIQENKQSAVRSEF